MFCFEKNREKKFTSKEIAMKLKQKSVAQVLCKLYKQGYIKRELFLNGKTGRQCLYWVPK